MSGNFASAIVRMQGDPVAPGTPVNAEANAPEGADDNTGQIDPAASVTLEQDPFRRASGFARHSLRQDPQCERVSATNVFHEERTNPVAISPIEALPFCVGAESKMNYLERGF